MFTNSSVTNLLAGRRLIGVFALLAGLLLIVLVVPMTPKGTPTGSLDLARQAILYLGSVWILTTIASLLLMAVSRSSHRWLKVSLWSDSLSLGLWLVILAIDWLYVKSPTPADFFPDVRGGWGLAEWLLFAGPLLWLNGLGWDLILFLPQLFRLTKKTGAVAAV